MTTLNEKAMNLRTNEDQEDVIESLETLYRRWVAKNDGLAVNSDKIRLMLRKMASVRDIMTIEYLLKFDGSPEALKAWLVIEQMTTSRQIDGINASIRSLNQ